MDWLLLYLGLLLVAALLLWLLPVTLLQCLQSSSQQNRCNFEKLSCVQVTPQHLPNLENQIITMRFLHTFSWRCAIKLYIMTTTFLFVCQNIMIILVLQNASVLMHLCKILFHRVQHRKHLLNPIQATDPGGIITMVTVNGRSFTILIKTVNTAIQETNPRATPGQIVFGTLTIPVNH